MANAKAIYERMVEKYADVIQARDAMPAKFFVCTQDIATMLAGAIIAEAILNSGSTTKEDGSLEN